MIIQNFVMAKLFIKNLSFITNKYSNFLYQFSYFFFHYIIHFILNLIFFKKCLIYQVLVISTNVQLDLLLDQVVH